MSKFSIRKALPRQAVVWAAGLVALAAVGVVSPLVLPGGTGAAVATVAVALLFAGAVRARAAHAVELEAAAREAEQFRTLHMSAIEALALAIDAKDQTSHSHIRRLQLYAGHLAADVGMSDRDVEGVRTAALLHDIGKLAVPEHILSKPGPLSP